MSHLKKKFTIFIVHSLWIWLVACHPAHNQEELRQEPPRPNPLTELLNQGGNQFDLWIRNGTVINGLDTVSFQADVLVRGEDILYVGPVDSTLIQANRQIDASGNIVSPGFIDTHAHGNPLRQPEFQNFLGMGVTSICLGQDGTSPNVTDLRPWMELVDEARPGVNIIPFIGHGTLRKLSGAGYKEKPAGMEQQRMEELLEDALLAGCFGMSTGLEYTPGIFADDTELIPLARIVGKHDGLIMSHIRSEDDDQIEEALSELLRQGEHCNIHVSHMKVVYGKEGSRANELWQLLDSSPTGYRVTADFYPYNASYTGISILFPDWAKPPNNYTQVNKMRRSELLEFLRRKVIARNGPEATLLGTAPYKGKTLAQLSTESGKPFEEVVAGIGPGGASGAYFVMNEEVQLALFLHPRMMVCSDGSPSMFHPRGYGSFAKVIETFVREKQVIGLETAIHKMTGLPAATLGILKRGQVAAGYKADLLIFDPEKVSANATYIDPHLKASGFDWVIVNGKTAVENGKTSGNRYGQVIKKIG